MKIQPAPEIRLVKKIVSWGKCLMEQVSVGDYPLDHDAFGQARRLFLRHQNELSQQALRTLAQEVVVRLSAHLEHAPVVEARPDDAAIDELCDALLSDDEMAAADLVRKARRDGMSADMICLGYVAGAARRLGERWDEDRASFVEVTMAAGRMYALLRGLRQVFPPSLARDGAQPRICFASTPGETHTLGVTMAADLFRRRGWEIDLFNGCSHDELLSAIGENTYSIFGISAGSERVLAPLIRLKVALRVSHPRAWIMVCGKITEVVPDLAARVDADLVATDVASAIDEMQRLITHTGAEQAR
jgi:methanogenic corrinoid protein MtbC1